MKPYDTDQTKKEEIREMFDRIAPKYDLLNHTLSWNIDRLWRRRVMREVRRLRPRRILDVATGTGDLAIAMARRIRGVQVLGIDLAEQMLEVARRKIARLGLEDRIVLDRGDAEHLDLGEGVVDVATVAFGVRNFEHLEAGQGLPHDEGSVMAAPVVGFVHDGAIPGLLGGTGKAQFADGARAGVRRGVDVNVTRSGKQRVGGRRPPFGRGRGVRQQRAPCRKTGGPDEIPAGKMLCTLFHDSAP